MSTYDQDRKTDIVTVSDEADESRDGTNDWGRRGVPLLGAVVISCLSLVSNALGAAAAPMHGDHNPHHGGFVMMYGEDLHYEIVLSPDGKMQLWLSGGMREDLPASEASDVVVEIEKPGGKWNTINMVINDAGECWEGRGMPIQDPDAELHLAFVFHGQSVVMSLPTSPLIDAENESAAAAKEATKKAAASTAKPAPVTGR